MTSRLTEKLVGRAPHQGVPPRELCDRAPQPELRAGVPAAHEGGERPRPHRPDAGGAGRSRGRRRHRLRLLAHRQRHHHGRRLHGLHHRAAAGGAADQALGNLSGRSRGPGRGRALLRAGRREADASSSAPTPSRSRSTSSTIALRQRRLRLRRAERPACHQAFLPHRAGRQDGGPRRPLGRRQIDGASIWCRAVRRDRGQHHHRRPGRCAR